jgi:hypothetical protein
MLSRKIQSATYVKPDVVAVAHSAAPYVSAYPWYPEGFGTKFADPASTNLTAAGSVAFHPNGDAIAVAGSPTGTGFSVYQWEGLGFGTKYTNPTTATSTQEILFSPAGDAIFVGLTAYAWSSAGFGTQYANVLPTSGNVPDTKMNAPGTVFAYTLFTSGVAFLGLRRWSAATGFGAAYSVPSGSIPSGGTTYGGVAFSPDNSAFFVGLPGSPHIRAFPWSDATGVGTQYADPATPLGTKPNRIAFSPNGAAVAVATSSSPYVSAYAWSGAGFGTKYANPATLPLSTGNGIAFNGSGTAVAVCTSSATQPLSVYAWSGAGFGTKFADPATIPTSGASQVTFLSSTT